MWGLPPPAHITSNIHSVPGHTSLSYLELWNILWCSSTQTPSLTSKQWSRTVSCTHAFYLVVHVSRLFLCLLLFSLFPFHFENYSGPIFFSSSCSLRFFSVFLLNWPGAPLNSISGFMYNSYSFFLKYEDWMCICFVCFPPYLHIVGTVQHIQGGLIP